MDIWNKMDLIWWRYLIINLKDLIRKSIMIDMGLIYESGSWGGVDMLLLWLMGRRCCWCDLWDYMLWWLLIDNLNNQNYERKQTVNITILQTVNQAHRIKLSLTRWIKLYQLLFSNDLYQTPLSIMHLKSLQTSQKHPYTTVNRFLQIIKEQMCR